MKEIYEAITSSGKKRITKAIHNYDGIIDEVYIIEDIYNLGGGRVHINTSHANKVYADSIMGKYNFTLWESEV